MGRCTECGGRTSFPLSMCDECIEAGPQRRRRTRLDSRPASRLQRILAGTLLAVFSISCVMAGAFLIYMTPAAEVSSIILLKVLGVAMVSGGLKAGYPVRGLFARDAAGAMARDSRAPVLYLRSFSTDHGVDAPRPSIPFYVPAAADETRLAGVLKYVGPVITVGAPGERVPPSGAHRLYVDDDHWEDGVLGLINRARLVVLRAGASQGLLWEVEACLRGCDPQKLLLFFPENHLRNPEARERYESFVELADSRFPAGLPSWRAGVLFIGFKSDWTPVGFYVTVPEDPASVGKVDGETYFLVSLSAALTYLGLPGDQLVSEHRRAMIRIVVLCLLPGIIFILWAFFANAF